VGVRLDWVFAADLDIRHRHTPIRRYARLQIQLAGTFTPIGRRPMSKLTEKWCHKS
jgi:hypothetical protein